MKDSVVRLSDLGSSQLGATSCPTKEIPHAISSLIEEKNGFYCFESSLHVFPWGGGSGSAEHWNSLDVWDVKYSGSVSGLTFFAEDAFGFQFAAAADGIYSFDTETADRELVSRDIMEWSSLILDDYEVQTGYPVMHDWQVDNGPIPLGCRLAPALPFFLGGEFDPKEMRSKESFSLLEFRAEVYKRTKSLPDGAQIEMPIIW